MSRRPSRVADALADWIPLAEVTGPFLTPPVLRRAFPNGFPRVESRVRAEMRQRLENLGEAKAERAVWLRWILRDLLEYGELLREGPAVPDTLQHVVREHGVTLRPDLAVVGPPEAGAPAGRPRLLVEVYDLGIDLTKRLPDATWTASPVERMALLCRATGVELGLVTDTNAFTLVWAPRGGATATGTWFASVWSEERGLFEAFVALLGARRFFAVADADVLEALFAESASAQVEVTNQLGKQVRQAVELLVDAFSRANRESDGQLMADLGAGDLETAAETMYSAAVTVMMRLVFLLCAEERRLFPVGDALYDESYAVSTMLEALLEEANLYGEEMLERRMSAWNRLLATFRLVHGGVQHETLRIPAYGGSLFDPDRFPFLEGRRPAAGGASAPPAITDRSVMAILNALQFLTFKGETRRVSFKALDVEQIGHVYEGLLDHGCQMVDEVLLGLEGRDEPEVPLAELEAYRARAGGALEALVAEKAGRSASAVSRAMKAEMDADTRRFLQEACENDTALFDRVAPFVGLLRRDLRGLPAVFLPGSVCMTQTSSRRDSGTEYTTRELADEVVRYTLEPLVYSPGPQDGVPPEEWRLKTAAEILALRVCDPAVGSGAILVAACRYLAERLAEAWMAEGALPQDAVGDPDALTIAAKRAVVDHCLYGVDRNPMAAEMAKLSLWLVTMAKERPFSFLDHAIQSGDSLLGLTSIEQITTFHVDPKRGREKNPDLWGHGASVAALAQRAVELCHQMAAIDLRTVRDAEEKGRLHLAATITMDTLRVLADAIVGSALEAAQEGAAALEERLDDLEADASAVVTELAEGVSFGARAVLESRARDLLARAPGTDGLARHPLHWPLAFPEVFMGRITGAGFDALIGNPPFLGGKRISGPMGKAYREYLVAHVANNTKGNADLVAYFFLRGAAIVAASGTVGLLATNTIAQGDTREVGLDRLLGEWVIYRAVKSRPWPGGASLEIAQVWMRHGEWRGLVALDGRPVPAITSALDEQTSVTGNAFRLRSSMDKCYQGSVLFGNNFVIGESEAQALLAVSPRSSDVLFPYLNGDDVNTAPDHTATRWAINFFTWPLEQAEAYPECLSVVRERVLPERLPNARKYPQLVKNWWQYWRPRSELYSAIKGFERVIVMALTSKTVLPVFVPAASVFSHALGVFVTDDDFDFGVLSSSAHWWWAVTRASTLETRIRYTPTDCFETFPMPDRSEQVVASARALNRNRSSIMIACSEGLTTTYNRFHSPEVDSADVVALRALHRTLDEAVMSAYNWSDIELGHGFHNTAQGVRYTISPTAQREMLDRLLALNHARYNEEVRLGLHEPRKAKKSTGPRAKAGGRAAPIDSDVQGDLLAGIAPAVPNKKRKS